MKIEFERADMIKVTKKGYESNPYMIKAYIIAKDENTGEIFEKRLLKKYGFKKPKSQKEKTQFIKDFLDEKRLKYSKEYEEKYAEGNSPLITHYLDEFLRDVESSKKAFSTKKATKEIAKNYLRPFYKNERVCSFKKLGIEFSFFLTNELNGTPTEKSLRYGRKDVNPLSPKRILNIWIMNKTFINYLRNMNIGDYTMCFYNNPVKIPSPRDVALTPKEFNNLLSLIPETSSKVNMPLFLQLLYSTGLRRGEALALSYENINFKTGETAILRTYNSRADGYNRPKTQSSKRKIYIKNPLLSEIEAMYNTLFSDEKEKTGAELEKAMTSPIFTIDGKKPYSDSALRHAFEPIQKAYKFRYGITVRMHDLRRSFATNKLREGVSPKIVSIMLGHATLDTTLEIYASLSKQEDIQKGYGVEEQLQEKPSIVSNEDILEITYPNDYVLAWGNVDVNNIDEMLKESHISELFND